MSIRGTWYGIEIGRTGLTTAQFGLDVTGHNIANADTLGYTRQRIVSTAYDPVTTIGRFLPVDSAKVGSGVRVQILDQIRSSYLDRRFRSENTTAAYWERRSESLTYLQSFFDNVNEKTSINYSMAEFFKAVKIVAEDPVAGAPRTLMQTAAMDLVQQLNMMYDGLIDLQNVENRAVETKIGDINRLAREMVELNKAIYGFEITGMIANDLRDKRNLIIDKLSSYLDIGYEEYPDQYGHSMFRVWIEDGTKPPVYLVNHDRRNELAVGWMRNDLEGGNTLAIPIWARDLETPYPRRMDFVTDEDYEFALDLYEEDLMTAMALPNSLKFNNIKGGELKAHMDMRDGVGGTNRGIPYYIEMLNDLARALVFEINSVHVQGWSDNPIGSETGILFFDDLTGNTYAGGEGFIYELTEEELRNITAKNLRLSDAIIESAYNIAASSKEIKRADEGDPEELQRHNNINMNKLYDLFRKTGITMLGRDIGSFDDYGTVIRFDVGNTLHSANKALDTAKLLTLAAENQRTAIAGVSLDEEMVGLIKYQHAYNGAARVITAMDDVLDRLINGTGRVGL